MKYNKYLIFLYCVAFVIILMELYYGFIKPDSFGIGNALYVIIYLGVVSIIGFSYYSYDKKELQWYYFLPFVISLIPLIIIYFYYKIR